VRANSLLAAGLARTYRYMPRAAGYVHTSIFANTRALGRFPDDLCPLGARQIDLCGVPRVSAVYVWGHDDPSVLALHGWGADSTTPPRTMPGNPTAARSALPARCAPTPRFTKPQPNQRKPSLTRTIRPALPAHCLFRAYLVSFRGRVRLGSYATGRFAPLTLPARPRPVAAPRRSR